MVCIPVNLISLSKRRKITSDCSKYTMVRKPLSFSCVLNLLTLASVFLYLNRGTFMDHLTPIPAQANLSCFFLLKLTSRKKVAFFNSHNRPYFLKKNDCFTLQKGLAARAKTDACKDKKNKKSRTIIVFINYVKSS